MGYKKQVALMKQGVVLLCVVAVAHGEELVNREDYNKPAAMFVFGDSTLDVGNNNYLQGKDVFRANKPYNGIDFPGFPTGRYSNGYNTADYVAKSMGFGNSPLPFLSLLAQNDYGLLGIIALSTGVSYASGGAGILNSTNAGNTIPLRKQVEYFKATKARMVAYAGNSSSVVDALLAESVFLMGIGTNDMLVFTEEQQQNLDDVDIDEFYNNLVSNYSAAITELYRLGAKKFAIINVGLLGCAPAYRVRNPNDSEKKNTSAACWEGLNSLTAGFNGKLEALLPAISRNKSELTYSLGNSYSLSVDTLAAPWAVGFTNVTGACCGSGRLHAEGTCRPGSMLCADRDHYIYWDGLHVTQRTSLLTVKALYNGPAEYTTPINFKHLAAYSPMIIS